MPMTLHALADDRAVEHVQGCEQRGRSVSDIVMRHGAGPALLHRQARLGAVERLDLALLVDRQHHGMGRRIRRRGPTTSLSFAAKAGSVDSLKRRTRCGSRPCAAQIRCTERSETPVAAAIDRSRRSIRHRRCGPQERAEAPGLSNASSRPAARRASARPHDRRPPLAAAADRACASCRAADRPRPRA